MNIKNAIGTFLALPTMGKAELLFYPFFMIWRMPIAWTKSLWMSRVLLDGRWSSFMGFNPQTAINYLFYRTQWININRFGRSSASTQLGLGNYKMSNFLHITNIASYTYSNAGAPVMLMGTLVWCFSHLLWIDTGNVIWPLALTACLFFSTTCYAMAFRLQNYQIIGWMCFPSALYFLSNGMIVAASIAWVAASIGGPTQVLLATLIVIAYSCATENWPALYSVLPMTAFLGMKLILSFINNREEFSSVLKTVGATSRDVRYRRDGRVDFATVYFLMHYSLSVALLWLATDTFPLLVFFVVCLFAINQIIARFADDRSLFIVFATVFLFAALEQEINIHIFLATLVAMNPIAVFFGIQTISKKDGLGGINVYPPFDHTALELRLNEFISDVASGSSIFFSFKTPEYYHKIFDGYRFIYELFLYVCNAKCLHAFPDWYAVIQTNSKKSTEPIWGRSREEVLNVLNYWDCRYAVIYQEDNPELSAEWLTDFKLVSTLNWDEPVFDFNGEQMWAGGVTPTWFLIKKSDHYSVDVN